MGLQADSSTGPRWASRHPQLLGALLLVALHVFFLAGPSVVSVLTQGFGGGLLGAWPAQWAGLKPEAGALLIGVVQLLYVIPATLLALKLRHPAVAMGIVKAALLTFLVNLAGCGVVLWQISKIDG